MHSSFPFFLNFRLLGRVVFIPYEGEENNMSFANAIKFTTELKRAMDQANTGIGFIA